MKFFVRGPSAVSFAQKCIRFFVREFVRESVREFVRKFVHEFVRESVREFVREFVHEFVREFVRESVREFVREFVRKICTVKATKSHVFHVYSLRMAVFFVLTQIRGIIRALFVQAFSG